MGRLPLHSPQHNTSSCRTRRGMDRCDQRRPALPLGATPNRRPCGCRVTSSTHHGEQSAGDSAGGAGEMPPTVDRTAPFRPKLGANIGAPPCLRETTPQGRSSSRRSALAVLIEAPDGFQNFAIQLFALLLVHRRIHGDLRAHLARLR